ncbi:MAG TPA: hypothetical protein VFW62_11625, partial [bacterium]|nr:hypothetical protein [bacterium]
IANLINRQYPDLSKGRLKHDFLWMLSRSSVGRETAVLDSAIPTLSEALKFADMGSNSSSYSHWLTKQVFERSLRYTDVPTMDTLLRFLGDGGKVRDLEASLSELHPGLELPKGPPPMPSFWLGRETLYGRIRNLAISSEAKTILARWAGATASNNRHFLSISDFNLLGMLEYHQGLPNRAAQLDRVIRTAGDSSMGLARFTRLQTLLEKGLDPLTEFKLEDLADPASLINGRLQAWQASESPAPSQANAYLGARAPLALLAEMHSRRASLTNPGLAAARKARRNEILDRLFPGGVQPGHFRPEVLSEAFKRLGDPISLEIAQALISRDFSIEILPAVAFRHRANELSATPPNDIETAYYYPPTGGRTKGLMLFRQPELTVYSKEAAREAFFGLMAGVVHEYRHHRDIQPGQIRTKDVHLYQEMSGHFSEHLWKAEYGDIYQYSIWTHDTSMGPAMRFHDFYERVYGHWWQGLSANQSTLKAGRQGP